MKPNRTILVATCMVIVLAATLMPVNARAEILHSSSEQSEWVVPVFLPEIAVIPEINTDKWIDLADLPTSDRPESDYNGFRLPHINAINLLLNHSPQNAQLSSLTIKRHQRPSFRPCQSII